MATDIPYRSNNEIYEYVDVLKKTIKTLQVKINFLSAQMNQVIQEQKSVNKQVTKQLSEQNKILNQLNNSNTNVEETLLNVLLAIRQNECYKAWYPQQMGYPDIKVTGPHPIKLSQIQ